MSKKIIGITVGTQLPKPNFKQTDPTKGDYIRNKPDFEGLKSKVNTVSELVGDTSVSEQISDAIGRKVDKVDGKGLSTNDFTNEYKTKLDGLENITFEETDPTVPAWAKEANKPTYTADEVGADTAGTANNVMNEHNNSPSSHSDIRSLISGLTNQVNTISNNISTIAEEKVNKSGLTLGVHTDGLVYLFIDGVPHGNGLDIKANVVDGDVFGYVDENNVIVLNGALADGTYTIKYEMEDGSTIDIGNLELDSNVYYSVTNNLTNCVTSNSATQVAKGGSYSATITANDGYTIDSISVNMEGEGHHSISGNTIDIPNVTGNINIVATAIVNTVEPEEPTPDDNNYFDASKAELNKRIGSSGRLSAYNGMMVSDFIPVDSSMNGKYFRISGVTPIQGSTYSYSARSYLYDVTSKAPIGSNTANNIGVWTGVVPVWDSDASVDNAYIRISLQLKDGLALTVDDIANIKITLE